jgi:hypothetical protein
MLNEICTVVHINLAKWHSKNRCWIDSGCVQNTQFFPPRQFLLNRISLVRTTTHFKYHKKILILSGSLSFQIVVSSLTLLSEINAKYMDLTEKIPF